MDASTSICEVSLVTLVLGEISQVTAMMRKNARWAGALQQHNHYSYGRDTPPSASSATSSSSAASASTSALGAGSSASEETTPTPGLGGVPAGGAAGLRGTVAAAAAKAGSGATSGSGSGSGSGLAARGGKAAATAPSSQTLSRERDSNSRSASANTSVANQPNSLLSGFTVLKAELREIQDVSQLDAVILLSPFLDVVRSGDTSGPITATALASVDKFISYQLVHRGSPSLAQAMTGVAGAGTHCKFEASDSVSDEVVLLKILDVLRHTLTSELGTVLSDEAVCEMMETGLSMCCQMRLSEMLRRSAERTMQAMIISVFRRLHGVPSPNEDGDLPATPTGMRSSRKNSTALAADGTVTPRNEEDMSLRMTAPDPTSGQIPAASTPGLADRPSMSRNTSFITNPSVPASPSPETTEDPEPPQQGLRPYGLPSIREVLRVLISLLNPHDQQHTDSMRLMALGLLNVAFEIGGKSIGRFPVLRAMVADELCKYLFQLARSENTLLLTISLRVISNVFDTMREHLKLQQELFFSFLVDRLIRPAGSLTSAGARKGEMESELDAHTWNVAESPMSGHSSVTLAGTPMKSAHSLGGTERRSSGSLTQSGGPSSGGSRQQQAVFTHANEARELMLEYLAQYARAPDFMTNLWINYDCNVDCEDLFERLIKFLSRGVYPSVPTNAYHQDNSQLQCLDTLLTFVNYLSSRLDAPASDSLSMSEIDPQSLTSAKASKRNLLEGVVRFNEKPKNGISFLEAKGLIYTDDNAHLPKHEALAVFLKNCPRLDKKLLGDYLSRPDNLDTLKAFLGLCNFENKVISDAMRDMLEAFRLPGEAQQIDRITETFAQIYVAANPDGEIKNADAAYVLAFSIIMLNTDLHSPSIRKRMTLEDYARNLKGVNDKADFSIEYMRAIYDGIRKREIVMPEEHVGQLGFDYAWGELLRRAERTGPFLIYEGADFDKAIFTLSWKPVISALSYAFTHFTDDYMLQRAISGFQQCASLADKFGLPEVFDYTIRSLSKITGLCASQLPPDTSMTFPTIDIDGQTISVSPLALRFGTSFKAQLAAVVLFSIANDNTAAISMSWLDIFEIYQSLFIHSLLPQSLLNMGEFLAGAPAIPLKVRVKPAVPEEKRRNDGGLLSTLSSYLLSPYANGAEGIGRDVTDDDVEHTLSTLDCIASCRVDSLYSAIIALPAEALGIAVRSLVDLNERLTLDKIRLRPQPGLASGPPSPATGRIQVAYDPATVFMLELLMSIAGEAEDAVHETWPAVFEFVNKLLAAAPSFHHILLERAVTGLLRLASLVAKRDEMRDQVFLALDALQTLPQPIMNILSEQIAAGLSRVLLENPAAIKSATEWNLVFALWSATAVKEEAAVTSFALIGQLAAGQLAGGLSADNFVGFIRVLTDFATAAGMGDVRYRNSPAGANDPVVLRGRQALDMIRDAQSLANTLINNSSLSPPQAWETYWLPVLLAYSQQSVNGCREIRQTALANLQRTLIAYEVLSNAEVDLTVVFDRLVFPMLDDLLKPQVFRRDPEGMGETRLRASALLCKIFLHYLVQLSERQGFAGMSELWMKILGYLDRFMHSGRRDQMYEAVPESLKNVLLVMHASGFLVPPHQSRSEEQAALWDATFDRLDIFLPQLRQDLFPTPVATRSSQLALQPAPARSPLPSPSLPQGEVDERKEAMNVYL